MSQFWNDVVRRLTPYVPGEQPQLERPIKLNTNENPYPPSPRVAAAILAELGPDGAALRLYPDPLSRRLRETLASYHGLTPQQVFVGNGSDEVLAHIFHGLLKGTRPILFPDITYSFYPVYCQLYEVEYRTIPLDASLAVRPSDYLGPNGGIILPNPNAPTGRALTLADLEQLLDGNATSVVVVDEAYVDFGARSAVGLIDRYPNLLVVKTLSKARSLAGMRVGCALGHADLIEALERIKDSFNSYPLDRLAQVAAQAAYEDEAWFQSTRAQIIDSREQLTQGLAGLGFSVIPSAANFVFATHPTHAAVALAAALRERRIFVRHFKQPRIEQYLRITIGTEEECAALLAALREITGHAYAAG